MAILQNPRQNTARNASPSAYTDTFNFNSGFSFQEAQNDVQYEPRDIAAELASERDQDISRAIVGAPNSRQLLNGNLALAQELQPGSAAYDKKLQDDARKREAANIAAWEAEQTMLGGIQMTNAQALKTIHEMNQNADMLIQRAIDRGDVKPEDREKVKQEMQRIEELLEEQRKLRAANKDLSPEKALELKKLNQSPAIQSIAHDNQELSAEAYGKDKSSVENRSSNRNGFTDTSSDKPATEKPATDLKSAASGVDGNPIKTEPLNPIFTASANPVTTPAPAQAPVELKPTVAMQKDMKASGLDFG